MHEEAQIQGRERAAYKAQEARQQAEEAIQKVEAWEKAQEISANEARAKEPPPSFQPDMAPSAENSNFSKCQHISAHPDGRAITFVAFTSFSLVLYSDALAAVLFSVPDAVRA